MKLRSAAVNSGIPDKSSGRLVQADARNNPITGPSGQAAVANPDKDKFFEVDLHTLIYCLFTMKEYLVYF